MVGSPKHLPVARGVYKSKSAQYSQRSLSSMLERVMLVRHCVSVELVSCVTDIYCIRVCVVVAL